MKYITKPSCTDVSKLKKYRIVIRDHFSRENIVHIGYGTNEEDAINNDNTKCRGWSAAWSLKSIKEIPGQATQRYVDKLMRIWNFG